MRQCSLYSGALAHRLTRNLRGNILRWHNDSLFVLHNIFKENITLMLHFGCLSMQQQHLHFPKIEQYKNGFQSVNMLKCPCLHCHVDRKNVTFEGCSQMPGTSSIVHMHGLVDYNGNLSLLPPHLLDICLVYVLIFRFIISPYKHSCTSHCRCLRSWQYFNACVRVWEWGFMCMCARTQFMC